MPDTAVLVLLLLNFACIGALPVAFFRRGRFNLAWCLTALSFLAAPMFLLAQALVVEDGGVLSGVLGAILRALALALSVASLGLIAFTVTSHRTPVALWHQRDDAPVSIVTTGAYGYIRHPFYAAFLLAQAAALALRPHPITLVTLALTVVMLTLTAIREERRLCRSAFGAEYARYMQRTGRFLPPLPGRRAT